MELSIIAGSISTTQVLNFSKKNRPILMSMAHFNKPNRAPKNLLNSPKEALLIILVKAFANKEMA